LNLTDLQPDLTAWIEKASVDGAWTNNSIAISKSWLKGGLEERCVTRDLKWGVPVPIEGFENKVFYVWFDAPIGYISITANYTDHWEKWWKNPDNVKLYQFMGKDNVPFHTVVFPSSLIASGEKWTMLHHISTTEYLQYEDTKFSKTNGTGVFGDDVQKTTIAIDVWRYYLLVNRPEASDSTFSWDDVQVKNNNELIQNPGNLTNRVLKFIYKNKDKKVPTATWDQLSLTDKKFVGELMAQFNTYVETFEAVKIKDS
jgi:methionyl-tRNA synthetase